MSPDAAMIDELEALLCEFRRWRSSVDAVDWPTLRSFLDRAASYFTKGSVTVMARASRVHDCMWSAI